ncbi:MAG TPA: ATP-binding protein [Burkholderiales bacterium]
MTSVAGIKLLNPQPTQCHGLVEAAANSLREVARRKGLSLVVETNEDDLLLRVDRRALSQIVLLLLNNAIRFTERGSVRVGVWRRTREGGKTIEISIADTGAGVQPDEQAPLERPGSALHASQELAAALGGRIEMASELGTGTTFTLVLPDR